MANTTGYKTKDEMTRDSALLRVRNMPWIMDMQTDQYLNVLEGPAPNFLICRPGGVFWRRLGTCPEMVVVVTVIKECYQQVLAGKSLALGVSKLASEGQV